MCGCWPVVASSPVVTLAGIDMRGGLNVNRIPSQGSADRLVARSHGRLRIGQVCLDPLTFAEAIDEIERLVKEGNGGAVFTPNVDHVVMADRDANLRQAYQAAGLCLADGKPLVWASRLLGWPLPEKVSGADLIVPLVERAAARGWRVYLLGAGPGVAEKAAELLRLRYGIDVVGTDAPIVQADGASAEGVVARIRTAQPHLVLVALGAPKQELFIHRAVDDLRPAVALGIGAGLDFFTGTVKRAPRWMSEAGMEWLYRLGQEPRRLWRRYLINDPWFLATLYRGLRTPKEQRLVGR
jgi:N-acetylglucosaminyldiphosphoundecaprenol N-acetyl-beta-D-mannosaminyltransferase